MITVRGINLNTQYSLTNQSLKTLRLLHTPSDFTGKNLIFSPQSLGISQRFEWIPEEHHCWRSNESQKNTIAGGLSNPDADFTKLFIPFKISQRLCKSVSVILLMRIREVEPNLHLFLRKQ
jgi:hypothetical protein